MLQAFLEDEHATGRQIDRIARQAQANVPPESMNRRGVIGAMFGDPCAALHRDQDDAQIRLAYQRPCRVAVPQVSVLSTHVLLDRREVDFEYDGEMSADVALDPELLALYPFCRLSEPANVLIMPALHSAHISSMMLKQLGGGTVIGPLLIGLSKPVQILPMNASVSDIINLAALAAYDAIDGPTETLAQAAE